MILEEAGLGEKIIKVPDVECDEFNDIILTAYPKLRGAGGYELLRCKPNSRDLISIGERISSSPKLLKRRIGNGKVYIRPIQWDLSVEIEDRENTKGVWHLSPVYLVEESNIIVANFV